LKKEIPEGVVAMVSIPSFGPKKARVVWKELGITTIEELQKAGAGETSSRPEGLRREDAAEDPQGIEFHRSTPASSC
jgi:DNA polymerase (family 10)